MADAKRNQQYTITEAFITADRFGERDIDITRLIYELSIYESLDKPYLTGAVAVVDDKGLFGTINFKGTEFLTVRMSPATGDETILDKTFAMTKQVESVRASNDTDVVLFHLVESHAYYNSLRTLSRAYTSSIEKIITQICTGELQKPVDLSYLTAQTTAQGVRKFIVPFITPLDACSMLVDRATTSHGSPVYLYASIHDNNLRLGDLDKMLSQTPFNEDAPFLFSQTKTSATSELDEFSKSMTVDEYVRKEQEDTYYQLQQGGIGASYANTDLGTGITLNSHVSIKNILKDLVNSGVLSERDTQVVWDEQLKYLGKTADEYDSRFTHQVNSSLTYNQFKSYHDASGNDILLKIRKQIIEQALYKNVIKYTVPGTAFFLAKATVGDMCRFRVLKNISQEKSNTSELYDEKGSGNFLIYALRHTFRDTQHTVSMEACRLNRRELL